MEQKQSGKSAVGFCIRDNNGSLISAGAQLCGNTSILVAEAIGPRESAREAKNMGFSFIKICIEGDNISTVIHVVSSKWTVP